ncbi:sensor histidine kinase [Dongia sp.]|uniref:sensor histidine kinase n=1 Tax=Dongia sp. TaxID=1977262 RepID=UPI0035B2EC46
MAPTTMAKVTKSEIEAELISSLYRRTRPLLIANLGAMFLLTISLWTSADHFHLLLWAGTLFGWTMLRFALAKLYLSRPRSVGEARYWVYAFATGSGVAGMLWGSSVLLITSMGPDHSRLVAAFMMAALSASAIAGYTNSLIAFAAFTIPALAPFGINLIWFEGEPSWLIGAFVVFWGLLLWSMARHLNDGFRDNVALLLGNENLIKNLSIAKDRAEMANRAKTRFLGNMSHELRTPLNTVIGYSEMMKLQVLGPVGNPQYQEYVGHIHDRGRHLLNFVTQVFDLSQLEAGDIELTEETVDITKLVVEAVEEIIPAALADEILVNADVATDLPPLHGDYGKLRQVLGNLLANAVKFTTAGNRVVVSAERGIDGGLAISVSDSGIGMSKTEIDRVTIPFHRLESQDHLKRMTALKNDTGQTSTGLGLPISKLLLELHGGRLHVASSLGVGTTVTMLLPPDRLLTEDRQSAQALDHARHPILSSPKLARGAAE